MNTTKFINLKNKTTMLDYSVSARYNPMEKNEPAKYYASA